MSSPGALEGHGHVVPASGGSLLRASVAARLGLVAVPMSLLWLAVYWALT
jgi:hypothetical protein